MTWRWRNTSLSADDDYFVNNTLCDLPRAPAMPGDVKVDCDFVASDSPFEFTGTATVRVLNVISGASSTILSQPLSLPPGPRFTQWFCGTGNLSGGEDVVRLDASGKSRLDMGNATYVQHRGQVPDPSGNFTKTLTATSELAVYKHQTSIQTN